MALKTGDALTLRVTVAERVHLGGDYNVCLRADDGQQFWLPESRLVSFVASGERATGLALDETDLAVTEAPPAAPKVAVKRAAPARPR